MRKRKRKKRQKDRKIIIFPSVSFLKASFGCGDSQCSASRPGWTTLALSAYCRRRQFITAGLWWHHWFICSEVTKNFSSDFHCLFPKMSALSQHSEHTKVWNIPEPHKCFLSPTSLPLASLHLPVQFRTCKDQETERKQIQLHWLGVNSWPETQGTYWVARFPKCRRNLS